MEKEKIVYKKVSELKNNAKNPRKNDGAVDSVAKSIEKYGFRNPLIIDENNVVWCGNTRLKASKKLGLEEVPCIVVNDLTEKQMTELALLDNKTNEIAEWDFEMLDDILKDVDLGDFELDWGIDEKLGIEKEVEEDNFDVDANIPENPKVAVEVLVGHGKCHIIAESSVDFYEHYNWIKKNVERIAGNVELDLVSVKQDQHLAGNQAKEIRCGDNGIFKGVPLTKEEKQLSDIAKCIYRDYPSDGKYILNGDKLIICQSNAKTNDLRKIYTKATINPIGDWTGGTDVDTGATNRKLGSDMAQSVTGGGLHGKDLSKADVSVNIYAFLKAQETGKPVELCCAIGDTEIDGKPYSEIVEIARDYIFNKCGGFEKFAEWGLY